MTKYAQLIAFLSTLVCTVVLYAFGVYLAIQGSTAEMIGAAGCAGGATALIGILGSFKPSRDQSNP